jgi:DNA polymerase sigma
VVAKAKVPIVKLVVMPYGLKFDISIGKSNGLEAVSLIREHLQKWPPLRPLVTILKLYLLQRNMNEVFTGGLSSYALIISVVGFLQLHQSRVEPMARALLSCCASKIYWFRASLLCMGIVWSSSIYTVPMLSGSAYLLNEVFAESVWSEVVGGKFMCFTCISIMS